MQQSFVGRVWLDITEREKSHPIIYMTKIGKVSDVNAMRLTRPCPSSVLVFICVATLAEYFFCCFSTEQSAHQADLGGWGGGKGNFVTELPLDPQSNEGTCQGAWRPMLQQGTRLHENSPSWQAGGEQAQQIRVAEQGALSPHAKGTWTGVGLGPQTGFRRRNMVALAGRARMEERKLSALNLFLQLLKR